jgi:hypothetical protein
LGKRATGEVGDAREVELREGATGDCGREGWGTSMSSTMLVDAREWSTVGAPGSSIGEGAAGNVRDVGKQSWRRGPPARSVMLGSRV